MEGIEERNGFRKRERGSMKRVSFYIKGMKNDSFLKGIGERCIKTRIKPRAK